MLYMLLIANKKYHLTKDFNMVEFFYLINLIRICSLNFFKNLYAKPIQCGSLPHKKRKFISGSISRLRCLQRFFQ